MVLLWYNKTIYLIDDNKKIVTIMHIFYAKRDYGKLL